MNAVLPRSVAVQWIKEVPADYHARYRAKSRSYRYTDLERCCAIAITSEV